MTEFRTLAGALALALLLASAPQARAQSFDPSNAAQDDFVQGNLFFLTYHEAGHLILDQVLNLDQRGERLASEQSADDIATWLMLPDPDEPDQDEDIVAAMEGWLQSALLQDDNGPSQNPHYPDDDQRAARIACLLYGTNPETYAELGEIFPDAIEATDCAAEADALHANFEAGFGEHLIPPSAPNGARIHVRYEPASGALEQARQYLIDNRILEDAAEDISEFIRLPNDVNLVARSCGAGAAEFRYNESARQITACYEAVDWFMNHADEEAAAAQSAAAAPSDDMGSGGARVSRRPRPRP